MIYCTWVAGPALTDQIRNILFDTSQEMFPKRIEKQKVKSKDCEGYIYTKWKQSSMGYVYGILFTAHLETCYGTHKIEYIVRQTDFRSDDMEWVFSSVPETSFSNN